MFTPEVKLINFDPHDALGTTSFYCRIKQPGKQEYDSWPFRSLYIFHYSYFRD